MIGNEWSINKDNIIYTILVILNEKCLILVGNVFTIQKTIPLYWKRGLGLEKTKEWQPQECSTRAFNLILSRSQAAVLTGRYEQVPITAGDYIQERPQQLPTKNQQDEFHKGTGCSVLKSHFCCLLKPSLYIFH